MPREQHVIAGREAPPDEIVRDAVDTGCRSIAYTYTEPTIFTEYAYEVARLAHEADVANVYVTNGYMTVEMLEAFHPYLDGANVDLKGFRDRTYRKSAGARLDPVLDALKAMKRLGVWIEVTTLVIPTVNDDQDELRDVTRFIVDALGADTPWHISRFFPTYQMLDVPPTPVKSLHTARDIGLEEGLRHVYLGNVRGEDQDTRCPGCGVVLIRRGGYTIADNRVSDGRCPECGASIAGVGMDGG
jgi:pyruvate formate lyase activating enzyme